VLVKVVIDHVAGSRRGQRQEFSATQRVRFGRHPDCEVSFDPHKDIDRVTESAVAKDAPIAIEFGPGGPRVRLFVGDDAAIEHLPPPPVEKTRPRWLVPIGAGLAARAPLDRRQMLAPRAGVF
jgi:hypothetical protein